MVQGSERPAVQRKRRGSEGAENRRLWLIKREGEVFVMQKEEMESLAREAGFTNTAVIPADQLVFDPSLRKYCEDNLCGNYGKNYSCPPECGTPEEMKARTEQYRLAWIFQTIAEADWKDAAALKAVRDGHNARSRRLIGELRKRGEEGLAMRGLRQRRGQPLQFPGRTGFLHLRLLHERGENGGYGRNSLLVRGGKSGFFQPLFNGKKGRITDRRYGVKITE